MGLGAALPQHARTAVGWWLFGSAAAVLVMVGIGGVTRLTRSGLSMTEWKFTGERWPGSQVRCVAHCVLDPQDAACDAGSLWARTLGRPPAEASAAPTHTALLLAALSVPWHINVLHQRASVHTAGRVECRVCQVQGVA